ncbi:MAG TPA: bile acid:sodium symporter [Syntrophobacteraceae bacterium]|nr:bile acid:sodium symporter [Syntrophobacteraceae bacterium]
MDSWVRFLTFLFLITAMLGIGLEVTRTEIRSTLGQRSLLVRSLLANFVFVPALGLLILRIVPMPMDTAVGFLLLAVAPGGMSALQFTSRASGALFYGGALAFILSVLSVIISPAIAAEILPVEMSLSVPYGRAIGFLLLFLLLPLLLGLAVHQRFPKLAENLAKPAAIVAALSFVAFMVYLLDIRRQAMAEHKSTVVAAMFLFIVGSMVIGWVLGGPERETRRVLATASSMRNTALCYLIATRSFPGMNVDVAVIAFSALMVPPNTLFTVYSVMQSRRKGRVRS